MIWRLNVCDFRTGVCLYESVWKWLPDFEGDKVGICNLMLNLHKFSKEIDGSGTVKSALFEYPAHRSRKSSHHDGARPRSRIAMPEMLQLSCQKDERLVVGLFHDRSDNVTSAMVELLKKFNAEFASLVDEMRSTLDDMIDEKKKVSTTVDEVMQKFKAFDDSVKSLIAQPISLNSNAIVPDEEKDSAGKIEES